MKVNFKQKIIRLKKDATFDDFKHEILKKEHLVIKKIFVEDKLIKETARINNYDIFTCEMDPNEFVEYTPGKYRCKNCRKYFREVEWICAHNKACKAQYSFKIKKYNKFEEVAVNLEDEEDEEEEDNDEDKKDKKTTEEVNEVVDSVAGKAESKIFAKIMSILGVKPNPNPDKK